MKYVCVENERCVFCVFFFTFVGVSMGMCCESGKVECEATRETGRAENFVKCFCWKSGVGVICCGSIRLENGTYL